MYLNTCIHIILMSIYIHNIYTYMDMFIFVCVYICIHIHVYIYILFSILFVDDVSRGVDIFIYTYMCI
jgi:hypothetical protein